MLKLKCFWFFQSLRQSTVCLLCSQGHENGWRIQEGVGGKYQTPALLNNWTKFSWIVINFHLQTHPPLLPSPAPLRCPWCPELVGSGWTWAKMQFHPTLGSHINIAFIKLETKLTFFIINFFWVIWKYTYIYEFIYMNMYIIF